MSIVDRHGDVHEVINQARTASYLSEPSLALDGVSVCDVLDFGGCATYALGPDEVIVSGGYIDFSGAVGNYATIPSGAVAAIPSGGDITVVVSAAVADWSPATVQTLVGRWNAVAGGRAWAFDLTTTGALRWTQSVDGTASTTTHTSSTNLSTTPAGTRLRLAVTFQANNGAGGRSTRFWTSTNQGETWTAMGTVQTTVGTTVIYPPATTPGSIGAISNGATQPFNGDIYDVEVYSGTGAGGTVGGTEIFRFNGETDLVGAPPGATLAVSSSGHPITILRSGSPGTLVYPAVYRCDLVPLTFHTPATDPAPWYNANYPESADALGFYVAEWTGLDDRHVTRPTTTWGGYGGGESLGVVSATGRTMAINLMLFARSEAAMEYLFRWLAATLTGVCATCSSDSILIRRFCGTTLDPWDGVVELRRVGLTRGLGWEADVGTRGRCQIRRASVMLTAGDPCMYLMDSDVDVALTATANLTTCLDGITISPDRNICRPSCSELIGACRQVYSFDVSPLAAMAPVVTFQNRLTQFSYPFRAIVYADPLDIGMTTNPCGLQILGEVYVRALPAATTIIWDVAGRDIRLRDASTGTPVSSYVYIEPNDPPIRRSFALPCGTAHLVLEPATVCTEAQAGSAFEANGIVFDPPQFPTVTMELRERISCP